jgi:methylglutamate dehydrogenase subunit D
VSDFTLIARPALAPALGRFGAPQGAAGVRLTERTGLALASIQGIGRTDMSAAIGKALGFNVPTRPVCVHGGGVMLLGTGPGQWLALTETPMPHGFAGDLAHRLAGIAAVTDQSDSRCIIRIAGEKARATLAKGVPVDLDPRAFKPGDAATTLATVLNITLWQVDDAPTYDIAVARSFAGSFWSWLTASAAEFGYEVVADTLRG